MNRETCLTVRIIGTVRLNVFGCIIFLLPSTSHSLFVAKRNLARDHIGQHGDRKAIHTNENQLPEDAVTVTKKAHNWAEPF